MSYLKIELTGNNIDRAIRDLQKNDIGLNNLLKRSQNQLIFNIDYAKKQDLFALFKNSCYNVKIIEESSFKNHIEKNKKRFGLIAGLVLIIISSLMFFSGRFVVKISGNETVTNFQIEQVLEENGIKKGFFKKDIDVSQVRNVIFSRFPQVSNVVAYEKGICLMIQITEQDSGSVINPTATGDLYSSANGTVEKIISYSGTPLVKVGDNVQRGDILIQGDLITETEKKRVRANGEVVLKVPFELSFDVTNCFIKSVITEKSSKSRKVVFFDPFAPSKRIEYHDDGFAEIIVKKYISENYFLPFYVEETTFYKTEKVIVMQNEKEVALTYLTDYMDTNFDKDKYFVTNCSYDFIRDENVFLKLTGECLVNSVVFVEDK